VAITAIGPCGTAATAACAPGSITPTTGTERLSRKVGTAAALAVLHATTRSLMSHVISAAAACTA
jgi:hypothetical protein